MSQSIPVLMYHYISNHPGSISVSPKNFENQCYGMAKNGWKGISLKEAEQFFLEGKPLPKKSVLITFDDGYLDNYVYAWPILKKYGHHGVIFAVTEYLSRQPIVRPTLFDVWSKKIPYKVLTQLIDTPIKQTTLGLKKRIDSFLSWEECRLMEKSTVIHIAAHSAHHHAIFADKTWSHVHKPKDQLRTFYKIDAPILWGMPCFKERPALHSRAFRPSQELTHFICQNVPQDKQSAYTYFQQPQNTKKLYQALQKIPLNILGNFETKDEQKNRIYTELNQCKKTLEHELGHTVRSFCWPWGGSSIIAQEIGKNLGFNIYYKTTMGANAQKQHKAIHRFKVKNKDWSWLKMRLEIYSRPWLANLYSSIRI